MVLYTVLLFLLGLAVASFLNAQMYRWQKGFGFKSLIFTPSQCEGCKKSLLWNELIPVLSYVLQGGKCTKCRKKISPYHPLSELFLGLSFSLMYTVESPWYMYIALCILFMMSYWDFTVMSFPKIMAHILLIFSAVIYFLNVSSKGFTFILDSGFFVGVLFSIIFLLSNLFYKNKKVFGLGDMFVILSASMLLSFRQSLMFCFSSVFIASVYGIYYAVKNKRDLKFYVPFVLFLTAGFAISLLIPLPSWIL